MDLDWCLTCERRIEGKNAYCSPECRRTDNFKFEGCYDNSASSSEQLDEFDFNAEEKRHSAQPHSSSSHNRRRSSRRSTHHNDAHVAHYAEIKRAFEAQQWPGHDRNNILAWASNIPSGCGSVRPESLTYGSPKLRPPTFPLSRQRPVPPALCMSTTQTQSQSHSSRGAAATPLATSTNQSRRRAPSSAQDGSASSLASALTDSIATPQSEEVSNAAVVTAAGVTSTNASPIVARNKAGVFDHLASRFWGLPEKEAAVEVAPTRQPHNHIHHLTRVEERGFTVLSTAHIIESLADCDEPALLFPPMEKTKNTSPLESRGVSIVAKDAMYAKKERAPVSLKVERMHKAEGADHPAYRTRGRRPARA